MPTYSATQNLTADAPKVFAFLADVRNLPRWNSGVAEVDDRWTAPREGARYRYRFPGRHRFHQLVCSAYRAPWLLGFRTQAMWTPLGTQSVSFTFRVRSSGRGTTVEEIVDISLHGGMLLTLPIVSLGWRRDLPEDMDRLRQLLEALETSGPRPATGRTAPGTPYDDPVAPRPGRPTTSRLPGATR
ncbi:SRPBCC family protein [Streptomyces sp. JJ36]|uniref:SRPBCC family protein n=1 Tax=Streptomyces sp. JJ36 TaxID=2736645 RepID=UPI001F25A896|nr:SRPBCC family protein [Streptomyces sp. JJ36]MCF6525351.1 SRPBCC family protein [Streptomyces sp. JJ36]